MHASLMPYNERSNMETPLGKIISNQVMRIAVLTESVRMLKEENAKHEEECAQMRMALSAVWEAVAETHTECMECAEAITAGKTDCPAESDNKHYKLIREVCHELRIPGKYTHNGIRHAL
jgi:hypothetical protein